MTCKRRKLTLTMPVLLKIKIRSRSKEEVEFTTPIVSTVMEILTLKDQYHYPLNFGHNLIRLE